MLLIPPREYNLGAVTQDHLFSGKIEHTMAGYAYNAVVFLPTKRYKRSHGICFPLIAEGDLTAVSWVEICLDLYDKIGRRSPHARLKWLNQTWRKKAAIVSNSKQL